ncbi:MAG: ATP-binding cassette domain-containing protein [Burkholderiaceae bacterium]
MNKALMLLQHPAHQPWTLFVLGIEPAATDAAPGRAGAAAPARVAEGLTLVPEGRLIFPDMTEQENLRVGAINPRAHLARSNTMASVLDLFPRLAERLHQLRGTLSGGEQQMLALGRGLMAQPRLLLLDGPTLGLAPGIAREIFQIVPRLVASGVTVLIAEQDVRRTQQMADYAYLIDNGRIGLHGRGAQLLDDPQVRRAYLGL